MILLRRFVMLAVGAIFVYSGVRKLVDPTSLESEIRDLFGIEAAGMAAWIARVVVTSEILLGLWLMANLDNRYGWIVGVVLLMAYSGYLAVLAYREGDLASCKCWGARLSVVSGMARNLILLVVLGLAGNVRLPMSVARREDCSS
jgi:uncharacterized membrane protein YphA (DoxX/SURF4 family)